MNFRRMVSVDLTGHTLAGDSAKPVIALVGRDILEHFVLIYNGQAGLVTLAF